MYFEMSIFVVFIQEIRISTGKGKSKPFLLQRNTHGCICLFILLSFSFQVALQINDTHPSISIAEVMRVLVDEEHLDWSKAWDIASRIFSVTIHAVQPEGLEKIPVDLLGNVLPRHLEVCFL